MNDTEKELRQTLEDALHSLSVADDITRENPALNQKILKVHEEVYFILREHRKAKKEIKGHGTNNGF